MNTTGDHISPRRNHSACVVGRNMLIYGGVNNMGVYLNDLYLYDIGKIICNYLKLIKDGRLQLWITHQTL